MSAEEALADFLLASRSGDKSHLSTLLRSPPPPLTAKSLTTHKDPHTHNTPLHYASANNHLSILPLILNNGADVHARNKEGNTALHWAALNGCEDVVKILVARGGGRLVGVEGGGGKMAMEVAGRRGFDGIVRILKEALEREGGEEVLAEVSEEGKEKERKDEERDVDAVAW